jgi:hypothetical protein
MRGYGMVIDEQARLEGIDVTDNDLPPSSWAPFAKAVFKGAASRDARLKTEERNVPVSKP